MAPFTVIIGYYGNLSSRCDSPPVAMKGKLGGKGRGMNAYVQDNVDRVPPPRPGETLKPKARRTKTQEGGTGLLPVPIHSSKRGLGGGASGLFNLP